MSKVHNWFYIPFDKRDFKDAVRESKAYLKSIRVLYSEQEYKDYKACLMEELPTIVWLFQPEQYNMDFEDDGTPYVEMSCIVDEPLHDLIHLPEIKFGKFRSVRQLQDMIEDSINDKKEIVFEDGYIEKIAQFFKDYPNGYIKFDY